MGERLKKMWSLYTMGCNAAFKQRHILSFATTWMNLEGIILNEKAKTRNKNTAYSHLSTEILKIKYIEEESRIVAEKQ